jgi:hypothetical protein
MVSAGDAANMGHRLRKALSTEFGRGVRDRIAWILNEDRADARSLRAKDKAASDKARELGWIA